ncbi:MAG: hypothetical protein A2Z32_09670 [Chloroflexi bacterium RBG_16_69_14]|nr:MAG: hypothetical protein A2Z32_09670 [Chloroflexi bacterium RBG_16_69_14]
MADLEELETGSGRTGSHGPDDSAVAELIARARRLTRPEVHALAGAVAWQWQPLALPIRGSFASARSEALAAAKVAGRAGAAATAIQEARLAALGSPGGQTTAGRWSWAENGLAAVLIGVLGAIVCATAGLLIPAAGFGLLAIVGAGVLLLYESARVARRRLEVGVEAAALALVVGDLVPPETVHALRGPWSTVVHD